MCLTYIVLWMNQIIFFILCVCVCVQRGCCPNLELLEVNTKLDSKDTELSVYIQALQMACPKLKVNPVVFQGVYSNVFIYSHFVRGSEAF